ncbi:MAG: hypothetical protein K2H86_07015 [Muribaculaceae bacterium]|nr:hypothetical protein [Muribaculaceae bacterium]
METVLTLQNCHRAKTVRPLANPEASDHEFGFRAIAKNQGFMYCNYIHTATAPDGKVVEVPNSDLKNWVVTSWLYEENLEDLYSAGVRAFSATSHTPEDRALQYIREYEKEMQEDLAILPENEKAQYLKEYHGWVSTLFSKHSRIASAMIVGPAKFPSAKNKSANESYDRAYQDFRAWRDRFFQAVNRRIEAAKPQEQKDEEEWQGVKSMIMRSASSIYGIDTHHEPYDRTCFVSNLYGRLETIAKNGKVEIIRKAAEFIKELNQKFKESGGKAIFTDRHKFWKLVEKAEETIAKQAENADRENVTIELDNCTVVKNYEEDRLQIFHEEKPPYEVISRLKKEAWRWSRNNGCWQRQLTQNACYSAARVILSEPNGNYNLTEATELAKKIWHAPQE